MMKKLKAEVGPLPETLIMGSGISTVVDERLNGIGSGVSLELKPKASGYNGVDGVFVERAIKKEDGVEEVEATQPVRKDSGRSMAGRIVVALMFGRKVGKGLRRGTEQD